MATASASYPAFTYESTASEVAAALAAEIHGKNVLITGTSMNGIGFEAARAMAKYANLVVITGHNEERLKLSETAIKQETPTTNIRCLSLDLSSLASVRIAAARVNAYPEPLHVLIHNAAAPLGPFKLTVDNLESQLATDHIAPFLLTKLLLPKLLAACSPEYRPRVVFVSSTAHAIATGLDWDRLASLAVPARERAGVEEKYFTSPQEAYYHAKSANILTAIEMSRRYEGKILGYSLHPGIILTNITQREDSVAAMQAMEIFGADGKPNTRDIPWKTIPQGAATTIAAAFDPRIVVTPGAYLVDSVVANDKVATHCLDLAAAERLWTMTETIIGDSEEFV
ncbi:Short-chain dehydrogenase/reductase family protein [Mycena indigotica]|uniref:Short-chain dehydrogenase/reductase family protein n=1 Tax=Mycena indigotica TaxID=2126181 RepID=A0A8H6VZJ4_9AGAR|nr:Short-chain dehydrogenase/reductase family protein [Mycena indigotica]KAF7299507.1 Short-chain dehydrogenase/reductase family protein [Mycena indigotica]